ncbi:NAD(+)/NADH kinase [Desulfovibrio inopinatus]|uniref:NAD(+)/NADH kinase n=1 Tax=Desulfovibrio inopinatus TaxID=102109 RepID=UPI0004179553|nr:NAD(+)/NADH kinase [Desulfovibrio inopinatus]
MQHVLIVIKTHNEEALALSRRVAHWLLERNVSSMTVENQSDAVMERTRCISPGCHERKPDLALVLGGDGTMISVTRKLCGTGIPLLGINFGRLGFLTPLSSDNWEEGLEEILGHGVSTVKRMMLQVKVKRRTKTVFDSFVVNDAVISRGAVARLIKLHLSHGHEPIGTLRADGVIVSTPLGSTAYCAAAGGPLVHPKLEVCIVTPVCPFLNDFKPVVLPMDRGVIINIDETASDVSLTTDGQVAFALEPGDCIRIDRAQSRLLLAGVSGDSYFGRLKEKGFFKER